MPNEVYPSLAWDNLFENRGSLRNMSILDRVKEDAAALSRTISSGDKAKLDEYLTSVREVEKRVDGMRKNKDKAEDLAKQKNRPAVDDGPAGERLAGRPARARAADVRHHRHRVPDGQDARRDAAALPATFRALYYPFLDVQRRAPRRVAQQQLRRLRAHRALPPEPARLSGRASSTACRKATARCSTTRA